MSNSLTNIFTVILLQIVIIFLYHLITKKNKDTQDILMEKLQMVQAILKSTKHEKIYTLETIKDIELNADAIFVFSKDIYRDVQDNGQFANGLFGISTFYDTVSSNLDNNKEYKYFLKKDANFRHSIISYFDSHEKIDTVEFFIIPSEKYFFYDEVYLYYSNGEKRAFEFLPSISDEKERRLFFIELDENQTHRLDNIKNHLITNYDNDSKIEIAAIKNKLHEIIK